jgi:hypothetical protein
MTVTLLSGVATLVTLVPAPAAVDATPLVDVKVTQKYLQPLCLDGAPVKAGQRRWRLDLREHSLAFTMRNAPPTGAPDAAAQPGVAVVTFTPEAGHRYEVETRAPESTHVWRVWTRGEWQPVVRDRTVDRIVSTEPEWRESPCER